MGRVSVRTALEMPSTGPSWPTERSSESRIWGQRMERVWSSLESTKAAAERAKTDHHRRLGFVGAAMGTPFGIVWLASGQADSDPPRGCG